MKVGGIKPISVDVRVIAASNIDMEQAIAEGKFRKDLYYRISMFPIKIPPLKDRKGDIAHLARFFIKKYNQEYGRNIEEIDEDAVHKLMEYNWPGNVRELENMIGRAIINMKMTEKVIQKRHLPKFELEDSNTSIVSEIHFSQEKAMTLEQFTEKIEKKYISHVLKLCQNNKTQTAKVLNVSLRNLYYKLEKYNIK